MKTYYVVEVIEPNENLIIDRNWKQKCNFYIEIIKIKFKNEKDRNKKY